MNNKEIAASFLKRIVSGRIAEAYSRFVSPDFKHHNPHFKGDADSLKAGMEENHLAFPKKIFEIKQILEDGDRVVVHSKVQLSPENTMSVVHIFRFEKGLIAELWDVAQHVPSDSKNENEMLS